MTVQELGNKAYQKMILNEYTEAIEILAAAVDKYPNDERLYFNRCYAYMQLKDLNSAMFDAMYLTAHFPNYSKGFFIKGEINLLTKNYEDAETCFADVLKFTDSWEAQEKLFECKMQQLLSKGYDIDLIRKALRLFNSTKEALKSLSSGHITEMDDNIRCYGLSLSNKEVQFFSKQFHDMTDFSGGWSQIHSKEKPKEDADPLMDPSNPFKCHSLWVGNLSKNCNEAGLKSLFSKLYATDVRYHADKKCAFVEFNTYKSAGRAMNELQNKSFQGQKLLIKYPKNILKSARGMKK